jgi:hypothetical protein
LVKGDSPKPNGRAQKKAMKTTRQNSESGLKNRTERLGTEGRPRVDFARRSANRPLTTDKLLALLRTEAPRFFELAEVVGQWVWVQFDQKQPSEVTRVLAELGFHWNNARQTWQHPCGQFESEGSGADPRQKYGSHFAADHVAL